MEKLPDFQADADARTRRPQNWGEKGKAESDTIAHMLLPITSIALVLHVCFRAYARVLQRVFLSLRAVAYTFSSYLFDYQAINECKIWCFAVTLPSLFRHLYYYLRMDTC